jgi:phosphohistidine phosphatase SixA
MSIYLVRHAKAGSRKAWSGPDELRPLSKAGRAQARALAKWFADKDVTRIVSSSFVRCRETVEPFAHRIGFEVELSNALTEGAPLADSLRLVEKLLDENAVLCTHGDVLGNLLTCYSQSGVELGDDRMEKGSVWVIEYVDDEAREARYVGPPGT